MEMGEWAVCLLVAAVTDISISNLTHIRMNTSFANISVETSTFCCACSQMISCAYSAEMHSGCCDKCGSGSGEFDIEVVRCSAMCCVFAISAKMYRDVRVVLVDYIFFASGTFTIIPLLTVLPLLLHHRHHFQTPFVHRFTEWKFGSEFL